MNNNLVKVILKAQDETAKLELKIQRQISKYIKKTGLVPSISSYFIDETGCKNFEAIDINISIGELKLLKQKEQNNDERN